MVLWGITTIGLSDAKSTSLSPQQATQTSVMPMNSKYEHLRVISNGMNDRNFLTSRKSRILPSRTRNGWVGILRLESWLVLVRQGMLGMGANRRDHVRAAELRSCKAFGQSFHRYGIAGFCAVYMYIFKRPQCKFLSHYFLQFNCKSYCTSLLEFYT